MPAYRLDHDGNLVPIGTLRRRSRNGSTRADRKIRAAVLERDGYRCRYCGAPATHADHVVPRSAGGADLASNRVAACEWCNKSKGVEPAPAMPYGPRRALVAGAEASTRMVRPFWDVVRRRGGDECWDWSGERTAKGYGVCARKEFSERLAHRIAWTLTYGPIPSGLCVLHSCDNPSCCNPAHLRLGTNAENVRDRTERERMYSKLARAEVLSILEDERRPLSVVAAAYGVSVTTVHNIKSGRSWWWATGLDPIERAAREKSPGGGGRRTLAIFR